jgi:hypothetical protein
MSRTYGALMIQPTKDELRQIIADQQSELLSEQLSRWQAQRELEDVKKRLAIATRLVGEHVINEHLQEDASEANT